MGVAVAREDLDAAREIDVDRDEGEREGKLDLQPGVLPESAEGAERRPPLRRRRSMTLKVSAIGDPEAAEA